MEHLIKDFTGLIKEERWVVTALKDLGLEKQKAIIENNVALLDSLMKNESSLAEKFKRLEQGRFKIQQQLAKYYQMHLSESNALNLIKNISAQNKDMASELNLEIQQLHSAVKNLAEINKHNQELIGFSLDYLSFLQTAFEGDVAGVYSYDGQPADGRSFFPKKNLLDHRV